MTKPKRYEIFDIVRGIAALAVVIFHRGIHPNFNGPMFLIAKYGEVGVQVFFVLSGFLIYQSVEKYFGHGINEISIFLKKRFLRIYPAFWASLIFSYIVAIFISHEVFNLKDYITSIFLVYEIFGAKAPQVAYWSLVYEQQFYIVMAVLILPIFNKIRTTLIFMSSVIALIATYQILSNMYVNRMLPAHWLEFLLGIIVFMIINKRANSWVSYLFFVALLLISFFGTYRTQTAGAFACLIFLLIKIDPVVSHRKALAPLRFLGKISYSLYLTHLPVFALLDRYIKPIFSEDSLLFYVISLIAALLIGYIFYTFFEKPFLYRKKVQMKNVIYGSQ